MMMNMTARLSDMLKCPRCSKPLKRMINWSGFRFSSPDSGVYQLDCNCFDSNIRVTIN